MAASQSTQEKTIMKKQTLQLASLSLMLMFAATVAQAQAKITVKVPFNFLISDRTFPAGQYSVSSSSGLLTVQDSSGKPIFIGFVYTVGGRRAGATGQIVFHCYDEHLCRTILHCTTRAPAPCYSDTGSPQDPGATYQPGP
jgi:hypothetical protein